MQRIKRFIALPAFWSSRIAGRINPLYYQMSGWDGQFNLDYMYRRGYYFGASVWLLVLLVVVALIGWAL